MIYEPENSTKNEGFTSSDVDLIKSVTSVDKVSLHGEGLSRQLPIKFGEQVSQKTVRSLEEVARNVNLSVMSGDKKSITDVGSQNAMISDELAHQFLNDDDISKIIGKTLAIKNEEVTIIGLYYTTSDTTLFPDIVISSQLLEKIQSQVYDNMVIDTKIANHSKLRYEILNLLNSKGSNREKGRYAADNNEKALSESKSAAKAGQILFIMIGSVSLFVAGFGVMNALYASISERSKEIAIRRSLGASKFGVQLAFQIEGTLLTIGVA
ncbi:hypothetical protein RyT2_19950 [Pseudolactococcus yaeyamensis]